MFYKLKIIIFSYLLIIKILSLVPYYYFSDSSESDSYARSSSRIKTTCASFFYFTNIKVKKKIFFLINLNIKL